MTTDDLEARLERRLKANLLAAQRVLAAAQKEPTVPGSQGQPRSHPGFETARRLDEMVVVISAELREVRRQRESDERARRDEQTMEPFAALDRAGN
jgi:hypothetical protein